MASEIRSLDRLAIGENGTVYPEAHVLIIITGGTICMRRSKDGLVPAKGFLQSGLAPRPSFNDGTLPEPLEIVTDDEGSRKAVQSLRTPLSAYGRRVRYCIQEFDPLLDSSSIDAAGWDLIAKAVYRNYQLFDGFVVLHGTDSLAYTSSALSFMLENLGKPVILTGSQAPMLELQNDAADNLLGALIIAGHFMIPEVCLFFNFRLFRGNRATKVSAESYAAFDSPNQPPLAVVTSLKTKVQWNLVQRPTSMGAFNVRTALNTHYVACLRIFPGIKPDMVDAVLRVEGIQGLILETFGAGNTPGGGNGALTKVLADAVHRGIVVVNVTQCLSGSVSALYAPATLLGREGVVFGQDMTSEAALTKLSYLLSLSDLSAAEVAKQMSVSLRGELTESSRTHFQHPADGSLTPEIRSLSALNFAVQQGDLATVKDIMERESRWLLNDVDYAGNTPLHIAAVSPTREILTLFLSQGASVHLRNRAGHTPLFLAAQAGQLEYVQLLCEAGAHLHNGEVPDARHLAKRAEGVVHGPDSVSAQDVWRLAGIDVRVKH